jgi:hypothetical protein
MLTEQQRQAPKIRMPTLRIPLRTIPLVLRADIINHIAEMIIRVPIVSVRIGEKVLWQLEDDGDENEQLAYDFLPAVAVEGGDFFVVFPGDLVEGFSGVAGDWLGDVEHLDVLFHSSVADPARVLAVAEILAFGEVAGDRAFFFQGLFEERVADAKLAQDTLVVDAGVGNDPEADVGHGMVELLCELLLSAWFVEAGEIDLHEGGPVKVLFGWGRTAPWFDQDAFRGCCSR